jgi:hypothetical protein
MYQISFAVSADDNPPRINANTTEGKTRYLFDKTRLSFSKKSKYIIDISLKSEDPLGLASMKI